MKMLGVLTLLVPAIVHADEHAGDPDTSGAPAEIDEKQTTNPSTAPRDPSAEMVLAATTVDKDLVRQHVAVANSNERTLDERSPGAALALSAVPTIGGVLLTWYGSSLHGETEEGVVAAGLVLANVGPTIGNIYAADVWNRGLQLRLAGVGTGVLGVGLIAASNCVIECRGSKGLATVGAGVFVVGAIAYGVGGVIEIANAPYAVQRDNVKRSVTIAPVIASQSAGITIGGIF